MRYLSGKKIIQAFELLAILLLGVAGAMAQTQHIREADTTLFSNDTHVSGSYLDPSSPGYTTTIDTTHSNDNLWGTMNALGSSSDANDTNRETIRCDREVGESCPEIRWNFSDTPIGNYEVYVKLGGGDYVGQNRNPEIDTGNGYNCVDMRYNPPTTLTWTRLGSVGVNGTVVFKARAIGNCGETHAIYIDAFKFVELSNSGGGDWQYSKEITISNSGSSLAYYQVLINPTGSNFPINANMSGADIRFTDRSGTELNYWIESWDYANSSAKVWVNVTSIPSGSTSIRMYYGNPSAASSSNGETTFIFFDDFLGTLLDSTKWSYQTHTSNGGGTGSITVSNGYVNLQVTGSAGTDGAYADMWSINTFPNINIRLRSRIQLIGVSSNWDNIFCMSYSWATNSWCLRRDSGDPSTASTQSHYPFTAGNIGTTKFSSNPINVPIGSWQIYEGDALANSLTLSVTGGETQTITPTYASDNQHIQHSINNYPAGGTMQALIDWALLAKYASPEPSVSFGSETVNITNSIGYSALVATGQNTFVQSSNGTFGLLLKGQTKTVNNSVVLNNTGDISARVQARFNDSIGSVFGLISGANLLNASNFALGIPGALMPLSSLGADVQVAVAPPGVTALDARLGVPSEQIAGDYSGTVVLTFSNNV